jgi:hypothetical protein
MLWLMVALLIAGISIFSSWTVSNVAIVGIIVLAGVAASHFKDVERRHEETLDTLYALHGRDRQLEYEVECNAEEAESYRQAQERAAKHG